MHVATTELVKLPAEEKLALIEALWDSLDEVEVPMPDWHRDVLEARAATEDAEGGDSWEAVKARLLASK